MNLAYCCRACKIAELEQMKTKTENSLVQRGVEIELELTKTAVLLCPNCANPECPKVENHQNSCVRPL